MKPYEISYYQGFDLANGPPLSAGPVGVGFNTLHRLNVKTGERRSYSAGPGTTIQEHIHIPSRQEGHEGYLLFMVDFHPTMSSEAHLVEAAHPENGPIARIQIPFRQRNQVHGSWVPEEQVHP
jgi:carotenoid cleavage dioxygenase